MENSVLLQNALRRGFAQTQEERKMRKGLFQPPILMSGNSFGPDVEFHCPQCGHEELRAENDGHDPSHGPKQMNCPKCKIPMHYNFPTPARRGGPDILGLEKKY